MPVINNIVVCVSLQHQHVPSTVFTYDVIVVIVIKTTCKNNRRYTRHRTTISRTNTSTRQSSAQPNTRCRSTETTARTLSVGNEILRMVGIHTRTRQAIRYDRHSDTDRHVVMDAIHSIDRRKEKCRVVCHHPPVYRQCESNQFDSRFRIIETFVFLWNRT